MSPLNTPATGLAAYNYRCLIALRTQLLSGGDLHPLVGERGLGVPLRRQIKAMTDEDLKSLARRLPVALLAPTPGTLGQLLPSQVAA